MAEYILNTLEVFHGCLLLLLLLRDFVTNEIITPESGWEEHCIMSSAMAMERPLLPGVSYYRSDDMIIDDHYL